jgi:tRNA threonylcarbamoyladenosine biosynthesis protein TsaB
MKTAAPILVIDCASPISSVALGTSTRCLARRSFELRQTAERLDAAIREVLAEADVDVGALGGVAALQGPGSFTGLRIALATALGLHQALGLRATALPTLAVLALAAREIAPGDEKVVTAAVDSLRDEWFIQTYTIGTFVRALDPPRLIGSDELVGISHEIIGFGVSRLAERAPAGKRLLEPPPLAAVGLRMVQAAPWEPERLIQPIYQRAPAVTVKTQPAAHAEP